jgi:RNA polymerase sigma factor (sigma-70 family)
MTAPTTAPTTVAASRASSGPAAHPTDDTDRGAGAGPPARPSDGSFGAWYAERWPASLRLATRLVGDAEDGADITASVLVDVWSRWQVTGMPEAPDAYLNRAIRNRCASLFRRRDRERAAVQRLQDHASTVLDEHEASIADRDAVRRLLAALPADERRTVALLYLADQTAAETARQLGIRPASVRSRVHRTRRRLATAAA